MDHCNILSEVTQIFSLTFRWQLIGLCSLGLRNTWKSESNRIIHLHAGVSNVITYKRRLKHPRHIATVFVYCPWISSYDVWCPLHTNLVRWCRNIQHGYHLWSQQGIYPFVPWCQADPIHLHITCYGHWQWFQYHHSPCKLNAIYVNKCKKHVTYEIWSCSSDEYSSLLGYDTV
jgi:hypothetical protein